VPETATPAGALILRVREPEGASRFCRLDLDAVFDSAHALATTRDVGSATLVGAAGEFDLIVIADSRRLVRIHFDERPDEILFPK
jgi:hypothetical protein